MDDKYYYKSGLAIIIKPLQRLVYFLLLISSNYCAAQSLGVAYSMGFNSEQQNSINSGVRFDVNYPLSKKSVLGIDFNRQVKSLELSSAIYSYSSNNYGLEYSRKIPHNRFITHRIGLGAFYGVTTSVERGVLNRWSMSYPKVEKVGLTNPILLDINSPAAPGFVMSLGFLNRIAISRAKPANQKFESTVIVESLVMIGLRYVVLSSEN